MQLKREEMKIKERLAKFSFVFEFFNQLIA
jgi:hypothetical protein